MVSRHESCIAPVDRWERGLSQGCVRAGRGSLQLPVRLTAAATGHGDGSRKPFDTSRFTVTAGIELCALAGFFSNLCLYCHMCTHCVQACAHQTASVRVIRMAR
jgi:hypothetical protein